MTLSFNEKLFIEFNTKVGMHHSMSLYIFKNDVRELDFIKLEKVNKHEIISVFEPRAIYIFTETEKDYREVRTDILKLMSEIKNVKYIEPEEIHYKGLTYISHSYGYLPRKEPLTILEKNLREKNYLREIMDVDKHTETLNVYILNEKVKEFDNIEFKTFKKEKRLEIITIFKPRVIYIFTENNTEYNFAKYKIYELLVEKNPSLKEHEDTHEKDAMGNNISYVHYGFKTNFPEYYNYMNKK